jgi:hypothetical protein
LLSLRLDCDHILGTGVYVPETLYPLQLPQEVAIV